MSGTAGLKNLAGAEGDARLFDTLMGELAGLLPQVVWVADATGKVTYFSRQLLDATGTHPEEACGDKWADLVHPDDLPRVVEQWSRSVRTGVAYEAEARIRRAADASYRWVLGRAVPVRDAGTGAVVRWVGTNTDIHAQKLAEERYRAREEHLRLAVRAADLGTWEVDYEGGEGKTHWSSRCREIFGFTRDEEITYSKVMECVHADDRERVESAGAEAGQGELELEYRIVRRTDGNVRWIRSKGRSLVDASGVRRRIGVTMDVTDAKSAEEEVRAAKELAESANRAKDEFLAVLSHELRTPLMPVLLSAGAMEADASLPPAVRDDARTIRRSAELEARLIDDLLDVTRIARGKLSLDVRVVEVATLLSETVRMVSGEADARRQTLGVDLSGLDGERVWVKADPARLQQVFWNLVKNAVKFTPEGGTISVRARVTGPAAGGSVVVEVSDNGIGIPKERLGHIFEAFEQGGATMTRAYGGLGLGLAICKSLAELHGGTLAAASAGDGKGATFTLTLPAVACPVGAAPDVRPDVATAGAGEARARLRILVVEDHPETRRTLTKLLRAKGYVVHAAGSVREAVETAGREPLDLMISDLGLPDGSGYELMTLMAGRHGLRGVALSGHGMDEDVRMSIEAGFVEHLTKPVDLRRLEAVIRRVARE